MAHTREERKLHVHQLLLILGLLVHPFHGGGQLPAAQDQPQEPENKHEQHHHIQDHCPSAAVPRWPHDERQRLDIRRPDMLVIAGPDP